MTTPTVSDLHVNRPLTNMSVAYMQSLAKFQADNLAPMVPSDKQSNIYFKLNKEYWFSDIMAKRGVGAAAIRRGYGVSTDSFLTELFALGKEIDDQQRANQDSPLNVDRTAMKFVTRAALMNREMGFKNAYWKAGVWSTDITGGAGASNIEGAGTMLHWDDPAATPLEDVDHMMNIMEKLTSFTPNTLVVSKPVWQALKRCPEILNKITGGSNVNSPAQVTRQMVAALMELDQIVVLSAVYNTAGFGKAMVGDYIFGKHAWLEYRNPAGALTIEDVTAAATITWQQYAGNKNGTRILKWRNEEIHSDIIEIESTYVHKVIAPDLGIFINGAIS